MKGPHRQTVRGQNVGSNETLTLYTAIDLFCQV